MDRSLFDSDPFLPPEPSPGSPPPIPPPLWLGIILLVLGSAFAVWIWWSPLSVALSSFGRLIIPSISREPSLELVSRMIQEIRSGELPPLEEDWMIGESEDLKMQDRRILVPHLQSQLYVERLLQFLQEKSARARHAYPIRVRLHDDRFSGQSETGILSHGLIYFGVSFVIAAKNEADIASVLAHEIGHVVLRHHARERLLTRNVARLYHQISQSGDQLRLVALNSAVSILLGTSEFGLSGIFADECQEEADRKAQDILAEADYDFSVMFNNMVPESVRIIERVQQLKRRSEEYHRHHPRGKLFLIATEKEFKSIQDSLRAYLAWSNSSPPTGRQ